jgi:hypothetical protein
VITSEPILPIATTQAPPTKISASPTPITPPTAAFLPADLPFTIDCSGLASSRQADCDSFIAATRDVVYPIMREITGVSLSTCYQELHYTILPNDPAEGAGGLASGNQITYNQLYSIDLIHRYDVHEILHSVSQCSGALDNHIFHGLIMNAVYARLGVRDLGYFQEKSALVEENTAILEQVNTATGDELANLCRAALSIHLTNAFFDLGAEAAGLLYRSTIHPQPVNAPSPQLVNVWGGCAAQVQALNETLLNKYKYPITLPACGF